MKLLILAVALSITAWCESRPIPVTICRLARHPEQYAGKIIQIRHIVSYGFESFSLEADCGGEERTSIWLEYGKGPPSQPTPWCCGDTTPDDALHLRQDAAFRKFEQRLKAQRRDEGCYEHQCLLYQVTATITGRFDWAGEPDNTTLANNCPKGGYGHFGVHCARLVIQSVANISSRRSKP